jgi:tetratricopeptide (TPR) repeat protein
MRILQNRGRGFLAILTIAVAGVLLSNSLPAKQHENTTSTLVVDLGKPGCQVELDDQKAGTTGPQGTLQIGNVEPLDHYVHTLCPDGSKNAFFVTPKHGETLKISPAPAGSENPAQGTAGEPNLAAAQSRIELREDLEKAIRLRASGKFEEAVTELHAATRLDPENSDLHRELGITFLLDKDWKRARVELIEALRHEPSNADAHNGLGYALDKLGEYQEALKEFHTASKLEPDDDSYRQHYLEALAKVYAVEHEKDKKK